MRRLPLRPEPHLSQSQEASPVRESEGASTAASRPEPHSGESFQEEVARPESPLAPTADEKDLAASIKLIQTQDPLISPISPISPILTHFSIDFPHFFPIFPSFPPFFPHFSIGCPTRLFRLPDARRNLPDPAAPYRSSVLTQAVTACLDPLSHKMPIFGPKRAQNRGTPFLHDF